MIRQTYKTRIRPFIMLQGSAMGAALCQAMSVLLQWGLGRRLNFGPSFIVAQFLIVWFGWVLGAFTLGLLARWILERRNAMTILRAALAGAAMASTSTALTLGLSSSAMLEDAAQFITGTSVIYAICGGLVGAYVAWRSPARQLAAAFD